jgi:hypothetical protein
MDYPVEKEGIRFYNYYYYGVDKPVTIEARSKAEARDILSSIQGKLSQKYLDSKIIGESVVIPLRGVSEKVIKGVKYIWVGEDKAQGGWLSENAYKRAVAHSKMKTRR